MPKKSSVSVPGNRDDAPFPVTGKNNLRVANWILKGVQKAHHGWPELLDVFCKWKHFPGPVAVPQYVEDAVDRRFGGFNLDLRKVWWSVDEFVQQAMGAIRD